MPATTLVKTAVLHMEKSAVAEHALSNADHRILFGETWLFSSLSAYFSRLHMDSVDDQFTELVGHIALLTSTGNRDARRVLFFIV